MEDILCQCSVIKYIVKDSLVGHVLKDMLSLHLTLLLLRDKSSPVVGVTQALQQSYWQFWKELPGWCTWEGVPNNAIYFPKLAEFLVLLFRIGLAIIGIYHSAISASLELHHHYKASNHPIISKSMHHFYLQHPYHINILIHGMSNGCYPCSC